MKYNIFICLFLHLVTSAQSNFCGSTEVNNNLKFSNQNFFDKYEDAQQKMHASLLSKKYKNNTIVYTIPVVVHVIHSGEWLGTPYNPTDIQIENYINLLNQSFSATFPDHPNVLNGGVDVGIQFVLAKRTPNCTPTNGINRINASNNLTYVNSGVGYSSYPGISHTELANMAFWDSRDYINLWLVKSIGGGYGGYAFYPGSGYFFGDGAVIQILDVYSPNPGIVTHEFGHLFGLIHTFQGYYDGVCHPENNCLTDGDMVCDTDPVDLYRNCDFNRINPCTGFTQETLGINYMSYACYKLFTQGQKDRMRNALLTLRPTLLNSLGGLPPGPIQPSVLQKNNYLKVTNYTDGQGQWYNKNLPISGATNQIFYPSESGLYSFVVTNNLGCSNISKSIEYKYIFEAIIFPNPTEKKIFIISNNNIIKLEIFDLQGKLLKIIEDKKDELQIDISNFPSATYLLKITTDNGIQSVKIIKK
jgi:hypothetical protein